MATTSGPRTLTDKPLNQSLREESDGRVFVVGIAGGTCSGKSSLTHYLSQTFTHSIDIHQDDFYVEDDFIPHSPKGTTGLWDVVESLDAARLLQSIKEAMKRPRDFCKTCIASRDQSGNKQAHLVLPPSSSSTPLCSPPRSSPLPSSPPPSSPPPSISPSCSLERHLMIIEGTMILNISELRPLLQAAFFITLDYTTSSKRRSCREYDGVKDPPGYYDNHVWPGYLRDKKAAGSLTIPVVNMLDGGKPLEQLQNQVETEIKKLFL